jgi:hypothetical protein
MVKLEEESNFKVKRINSNIPSFSSLSSCDKEIKIQVHFNQDRQYGSNAQHLYCMSRKIWKLSETNCLQLKATHIINVAADRLSRLEMSGDYH